MTPQEAIEIMKAAKDVGISELRFGELQFVFDAGVIQQRRLEDMAKAQGVDPEQAVAQHFAQNEYDVRQEELDTLRLTDPEAYERFVAKDKDIA